MGDGLPLGAHPVGDGLHLLEPTPWAMGCICGSPPHGRCAAFVGAHPVGDVLYL